MKISEENNNQMLLNNKTINVLLVGPFDTKGRYSGGISYIVNTIKKYSTMYESKSIKLKYFDTCRVNREKETQGKLSRENITNTLSIIKGLARQFQRENIDIVYYNTSFGISLLKDLIVIGMSGCKKHAKVIVHIHFADAERVLPANKVLSALALQLMKLNADHIVFLSEKTRESFVKKGLMWEKTSVVYNFHDISLEMTRIKEKTINRPHKNRIELLFMGSIDERKGIVDLLTSLIKVKVPYRLVVCGETTNLKTALKVENLINKIKNGEIELKGYVSGEEKTEALIRADILILPSYSEGFPIVLIEGVATGNAIIASDVGAIKEVFSEMNGRIIKPGDIEGISQAINELATTANLESIMLHNYEYSKRFDVCSFIDKTANICKKVYSTD